MSQFWLMKKIFFFLLFFSFFVFSNPQGMDVVSGRVSASNFGNTLKIEASDKSIINWNSFSIAGGEVASFQLPSSSCAVLNRVTGKIQSEILGSLISNGKVFLLNPSGIIIGPNALISTNSFLASTYDILDKAFLNGEDLLFSGASEEKVINLGTVRALDGDVILIGRHIENSGKIEAKNGEVRIGAGKEILLKPKEKDGIYIKPFFEEGGDKDPGIINSGEIDSSSTHLKADGYMYSLAIKDSGKIDALSFEEKDGEIFLVAEGGRVESSGTIAAKKKDRGGEVRLLGKEIGLLDNAFINVSGEKGGGEVLLGGDRSGKNSDIYNADAVFFGKDVKVKADSLEENCGGKVVLWSNRYTVFWGEISAEARGILGDGGFVEVSSGEFLVAHGGVSTRSLNGNFGTYLIDPCNITIQSGGTSSPTYPQPSGSFNYIPNANTATLADADLLGGLTSNNVIVSTSGGGSSNGDITISVDLNLTGLNGALTLNADEDILFSNNYTITLGSQPLTMKATRDVSVTNSQIIGGTAAVNITSGRNITVVGALHQAKISSSNNITLKATGNINIGSATSSRNSSIESSSAGTISLTVGDTLSITGGNILAAASNISSSGGAITIVSPTVNIDGGTVGNCPGGISQTIGTITLTPPTGATTGGLNITEHAGVSSNAGIFVQNGTINITTAGDINIMASSQASAGIAAGTLTPTAGTVNLTGNNLNITGGGDNLAVAGVSATASGNLTLNVNSINLTSGTQGNAKIFTGFGGVSNITGSSANGITLTSNGAIASIDSSESGGLGDITFTKTGLISMTSASGTGGCSIVSGGIISLAGTPSISMAPNTADTVIKTVTAGKSITINSSSAPGSGGLSFNSSALPASPHIAAIYTDKGGDIALYFSGASTIKAGLNNISGSIKDSGIMTGFTSGSGNITGSLGSLTMLGGSSSVANKSSATISTGYASRLFTGGGNIDLTLSSLSMIGGGISNDNAEIVTGIAGGTIKITSTGSITLNGGTGVNSSSSITTKGTTGNQTININSPSLTLQGGTPDSTTATISTSFGDIIIGDQKVGTISLIGDSGNGSYASITPGINFNSTISSSNLIMQGGSGQDSYANISTTGIGNLSFPLVQGMNLVGGSGIGAYASISSTTGDITINSPSSPQGYLNLTGGSNDNTYAQISSTAGGNIQASFALDSSIVGGTDGSSNAQINATGGNIDLISRNLSLTGGINNSSSSAAIITTTGVANITSNGSITLQSNVAPAFIQFAQNIYALKDISLIGAAPSPSYILTAGSVIPNIYVGGNLNILGSLISPSSATDINIFVGRTMNIFAQTNNADVSGYKTINLKVLGKLTLKGSSTNPRNAYISGNGPLNINTGSVDLIGGSYPLGGSSAYINSGGDINLNVYSTSLILSGGPASLDDAYISANGKSSIFVQGMVELFSTGAGKAYISSNGYNSFNVGQDVWLLANPNGAAYIKDLSNQDFTLSAGGNITLIDYAKIENVGGNLTLLAGDNIVLSANSKIINDSSSDLTLVVDNNYPSFPDAGEGQFNLSADSTVANTPVGSGQVRIFSVLLQFNIIQGLINGYSFSPGPFLVNSSQEVWGVYYPSSFFGGPGFTIFYKVIQPFIRTIMGAAMFANSELFYRLNNMQEDFYIIDYYDRYIRRAKTFCVGYDLREYRGLEEYQDCEDYTIHLRFD